MNKSRIIASAALVAVLLGLGLIAACTSPAAPTQAPAPAIQPTTAPAAPVKAAPAAEPTKPAAPTAAPTVAPTVAPAAATKPAVAPPVAELSVLAVPGNAAGKNAITTTISYITSTVVGPAKATAAIYTSGLSNVPINVPVKLSATAQNSKEPVKPAWTLTRPPNSKAEIRAIDGSVAQFIPDVVGAYQVGVTLKSESGLTSAGKYASFNAGTYIGVDAGNCQQCHTAKTAEWEETGHARILAENIDNVRSPEVGTHYTESCVRCHSVGYYPAPYNGSGGYWDAKAKANMTFPTWTQIDAAGKKTGPSNFASMPAAVKNVANIQCEVCHGPANEHVKTGAKVMDASLDNGVCNQCHAAGGSHNKGIAITNSKHSDEKAAAWTSPTGDGRQACVRCHTAKGYASFIATPTNQAAWNNEPAALGCAGCHDPHSEANPFQLRIVGKPVELPFAAGDVGLSATCYECHNNRTKPENAVNGSFPHYSSAAEQISNTGGVTYGQSIPDSPHGTMLGVAPIPNPAAATNPGASKFLFTSPQAKSGNVPGACVTCHMWAGPSDAKDPGYTKVGAHSFNTSTPDGKIVNTGACTSCHKDLKEVNVKARSDFDGNGKVEGVQDEVKGLLNTLWKALEAKGFKKLATGHPYATLPTGADGKTDPKLSNAWYNYRYVYGVMWGTETGNGNEGKGAAIHNFKRSVGLLQASIKDVTGSLPAGAVEMR